MLRCSTGVLWVVALAGVAGAADRPAVEPTQADPATTLLTDSIRGPDRDRIVRLIEKPVVHRREQAKYVQCHPELLDWLIRHPDWVAEFWREMGVDVGVVERAGEHFVCRLSPRVSVRFLVVGERPGMRVVHCLGEAKRPLGLGAMQAEMVIVQHQLAFRQPDGAFLLCQQLEGFAAAKGVTQRTFLKIAHSTGEKIVDLILENMSAYFAVVCQMIHLHPDWTAKALDQIASSFPAEERAELQALIEKSTTALRAADTFAVPEEAPCQR